MQIKNIIVGVIHTNSYLIIDDETHDAVIVDPGFNSEKLISEIDNSNCNLKYIILTHAHFDHCFEAQTIKDKYNAKIICSSLSKEVKDNDDFNQSMSFLHKKLNLELNENDIYLNDGDEFNVGNLKFKSLHIGGHTKDSSAYYLSSEKFVLTGDTLFFESVGRSDLPSGDTNELFTNIEEKLLTLPDDTVVLPGHGDETTIGHEKLCNMFI